MIIYKLESGDFSHKGKRTSNVNVISKAGLLEFDIIRAFLLRNLTKNESI